MANKSDKEEPKTSHPMRRLVGRAIVAGAEYAGSRMDEKSPAPKAKKKSHKVRNMVGLATVAGAALVTEEIIRKRKNNSEKNST